MSKEQQTPNTMLDNAVNFIVIMMSTSNDRGSDRAYEYALALLRDQQRQDESHVPSDMMLKAATLVNEAMPLAWKIRKQQMEEENEAFQRREEERNQV